MVEPPALKWSGSFQVTPPSPVTKVLPGDKILLPPSVLETLLRLAPGPRQAPSHSSFDPFEERIYSGAWQNSQQQAEPLSLPHPLTFQLVNQKTGAVVFAGIREFSAEEGQIGLSPFLSEALGIKSEVSDKKTNGGQESEPIDLTNDDSVAEEIITVHVSELPKGTYVRLRPLEAGYNPDDWKALLERHLRENYTTLTNNEVLTIPDRSRRGHDFRFLIDKFTPEGNGICVVDTDLEVDIEALNEEQARETLKQIISKEKNGAGTAGGSSAGGALDIWTPAEGQVLQGEYVDYELSSWDRTQALEIELTMNEGDDVDLLISPLGPRQRAKPREDEHVLADFSSDVSSKTFKLKSTNVVLEDAESLYISVRGYKPTNADNASRILQYSLRARIVPDSDSNGSVVDLTNEGPTANITDEVQCKNCRQMVPKRALMLHENFCFRNNIACPKCESVFRKNSAEWEAHWHCEHDTSHGNSLVSKAKHDEIFHRHRTCDSCGYEASSMPDLAQHRTTVCPEKLILCKFCHLSVPQEGDPNNPSAEQLLSGLTAHELADGSRTTNCHLCQAIVRLRDMDTHLKHHEMNKSSKPSPRICRNINCGRTLYGVGKNGKIEPNTSSQNRLGLCGICYGPLYVSMHDPEGKAMKRRIERRYLSQLITGCGKEWCANEVCKAGKAHLGLASAGAVVSTKDALPTVQTLLTGVFDESSPMYFCVDEASQKRRKLAEMMASEGVFDLAWCVAACEAENGELDSARQWLANWAPKKGGQ